MSALAEDGLIISSRPVISRGEFGDMVLEYCFGSSEIVKHHSVQRRVIQLKAGRW